MKALLIILGIILFFILILSVKFKVTVHSEDGISLSVGWLFLKFNILPKKEKKKKKEKKPKKEKKKKEKPEDKEDKPEEKKDETIKEPKKKGKDNIFKKFYRNNGVSGVVELVERVTSQLGGMFKGIGRAFLFEELYISLLVGAGDSAETAIKYGKVCSAIYPAMGLIVDTMRVNKYSVDVNPDFIEGRNKARLHTKISVRPISLINAVIRMAFGMIFRVGIRFLKGTKKPLQK